MGGTEVKRRSRGWRSGRKRKAAACVLAQAAAYMSRSISRVLLSYGHLSRRTVAGTLQPPRERPGQPIAPIPVLLRIEFTAADAFTRRRVSSYLAFPPLPAAPQSPQPAVYLCCTFPEVAFGGRYPLSLPCGARTFLIGRLSPCRRDCLIHSQYSFYPTFWQKSTAKAFCGKYVVISGGICYTDKLI